MMVTRFNPLAEIERSLNLVNDLLRGMPSESKDSLNAFIPAVNTREDENNYYIEVDLPGIKKEDVEISLKDNVLTISGERKFKNEVKEEDYYKIESAFGKFSRSFTLPENADIENIEAKAENGVLEITIPLSSVSYSLTCSVFKGCV